MSFPRTTMTPAFAAATAVPRSAAAGARSSPLSSRRPVAPAQSQHLPTRRASVRAAADEQGEAGAEAAAPDMPFPALYDAWFAPDHQLRRQMQESVNAAVASGATALELQWPVVPNLEEISAGTLLNFEFGKFVAAELGMAEAADYALIRRYLASFCNLYWAREIARTDAFAGRTAWAVATDSVSKKRAEAQLSGMRVTTLRDASKNKADIGADDVVIVIDPRFDDAWKRGMQLKPENGFVVFLNSQFNESYGLTGPRRGPMSDVVAAYFLKRVTRGYVFRAFPGPWRACMENPDMSVEELKRFDKEPKLRDVAAIVRTESNNRYGGFFNDRYVRGFGGRL